MGPIFHFGTNERWYKWDFTGKHKAKLYKILFFKKLRDRLSWKTFEIELFIIVLLFETINFSIHLMK